MGRIMTFAIIFLDVNFMDKHSGSNFILRFLS